MNTINNDVEYNNLINDILNNEEFTKLKTIEHHGTNRITHSLRVSYLSYKITKTLKLSYKDVARAGLLHDFAFAKNGRNFKEKFKDTFTHPKQALSNSKELFNINDLEANIIESHMFPFYTTPPAYLEAWIVDGVDKVVGSYEFIKKFKHKIMYFANMYILVLINVIK